MALATLAQVRAKLKIPASDTSEDADVQAVLNAAERYVLDRTGYTLVAETVEEIFPQSQVGRAIHLRKRPVVNASAQVRTRGSPTWLDVAIDIIDPAEGVVVLPLALLSTLPAQGFAPAHWFSWRNPVWDVLKVIYTTAPLNPIPADLSDATAQLAAYWYRQQLAGPISDTAVGNIREAYSQLPIPPAVEAVLAKYDRREVRWW